MIEDDTQRIGRPRQLYGLPYVILPLDKRG